jgi:hypothetical protein
MTIEINGMAHVILKVSRFEVAREFYRKLLPEFGMKPVFDGDKSFYCVEARTAIGIEPCDPALAGERFVQWVVPSFGLMTGMLLEAVVMVGRDDHAARWAIRRFHVMSGWQLLRDCGSLSRSRGTGKVDRLQSPHYRQHILG